MVKLTQDQIKQKINFMKHYIEAENAAEGAIYDPNANVDSKNIATLEAEIHKDFNRQINRALLVERIEKMFDKETANEYLRMIESGELYKNDETSVKPYCTSVSMYPLLLDGMTKLGGESKAPKHFQSFNGIFINFVFAVAAQFAGAVATVEWLMYFDYFARKDFGDNYLETHENIIKEALQHVVYSINQPAAARGYQSVFWNISIYDKYYFDAMFGNFVFPDMSKPKWETVNKLQKYFMKWFNKERTKSVLTYPVVTAALLTENGELKDKEYEEFLAEEMSKGNSFFLFMSDSPHALSSCCFIGDEIIEVKNEKNNSIEKITIKDFVNKFIMGTGEKTLYTGYKIKSLNPETLKIEWVDINGVLIKNNEYKRLINIKIGDKYIKVTPDHPFLVKDIDSGEIKKVFASDLYNHPEKYLIPVEN